MKCIFSIFIAFIVTLLGNVSLGEELQPLAPVTFSGEIIASEDVSAIAKIGSFLVIGSDEGGGEDENENFIQLLKNVADNRYEVQRNIFLFKGNEEDGGNEMDIEGIATEGDAVYVIGSHSSRRKRIKEEKKYQTNRKLFRDKKIDDAKNRDWLYRLTLDAQGKDAAKEKTSLRGIIKKDEVLKTFSDIPSKENGIDIEGIAAKDGWLYVGFRGPVFRENYVPVMKLNFDDPKGTYELLYVNLGGRGIRDITSVSDGFLIVAGPVGDGPASYQLYHWDGKDSISGKDRSVEDLGKLSVLAELWRPQNAKAEGIVVLQEQKAAYDIIIVYDGVQKEAVQRFHVPK